MSPFSRRLAPTLLILALVGLAPRPAGAWQQPQPGPNDAWIGKRVITQYGAVLYIDGKPVDDADRTKNLARGKDQRTDRVYKATRADGPWVWIVAENGSARGWVQPEYLAPSSRPSSSTPASFAPTRPARRITTRGATPGRAARNTTSPSPTTTRPSG